jgi:hypothetical protein
MRLLPAGSLSLVQAPPADNVSGKSESATGNDSQTPPAAAASPTPAPAIPAAAPAPADSAPTPTQFTEQAKEWRAANMADSGGWSPVDFDLAAVRERLDFLLDRQQRERASLEPRSGGDRVAALSSAGSDAWRPPVTEVDAAPWSRAVQTRNKVLLELPLLIDAVDRVVVDGAAGDRADPLRDRLRTLLTALERLVDLTDRDVLTETRTNTDNVLFAPVAPSRTQCNTTALAQPHHALQDAFDALRADLRAVAWPSAASPADWLNVWELGQAIPWTLLDEQAQPPLWKPPVLAVRRSADAAASRSTTAATPGSVNNAQLDRGKDWLRMHGRVADLLPAGNVPAFDQLGSATAADAARFNTLARSLRDLHVAAAAKWAGFDAASEKASEHLAADRCGRLAIVLTGNPAQSPQPGRRLTGQAPGVKLALAGPRLGSASTEVEQAIHLKLDEPTAVAWQVRTDDPLVRGDVLVALDYGDQDLEVLSKSGQRIAPTRPGQGPVALAELIENGEISLGVRARREIRPEEAKVPGGNSMTLNIALRLGDQRVLGAARFQLPDPRYLEVQVAGYKATVRRGADVVEPAGAGRSWFQMPPDDSQSPRRPDSGDFRVELFPFPRGTSEFDLRLISAKERKLVATWYVPQSDTVPMQWPDWNRMLDSMQKFPRSQTITPGAAWQVPLYDAAPPAAAPPAASAAPPAAVPDPLPIANGLLLVLTDEQEPDWRQRIWLHARPLHPDQYLSLAARYRAGQSGTAPDSVEVAIDSLPAVRDHLKPGKLPVSWFELADARLGRPAPAPRDFSLPDQPPVIAQLIRETEPTGEPLLAILSIDGYPRAAQFPGIRRSEAPVAHQRRPYLVCQLFEELPPAAPLPPGTPAPPPKLKLLEGTKYVQAPLRLAYQLFADFDPGQGESLRLTENGNASSPLVRRAEDRQFEIFAHKPASPTSPQLVLDGKISEWQGSLCEPGWLRRGQNVVRAEIVTTDRGQEHPLPADGCRQEFVIVLDDEKPRVSTDVTATLEPTVGSAVNCRFRVVDLSLAPDDAPSGVRVDDVMWATEVNEEALVNPRKVLDYLTDDALKPGVEVAGKSVLCVLPNVTAKEGRVSIYVQATDRAGNISLPREVLKLNVKPKRELELIPGGGKAAKAKS